MKILTPDEHQQIVFALGAATGAIARFAAVSRHDDTGYRDCQFCLTAIAREGRNRKPGTALSTIDDDGTPLEHRPGCSAAKALDEIEKALRVLG